MLYQKMVITEKDGEAKTKLYLKNSSLIDWCCCAFYKGQPDITEGIYIKDFKVKKPKWLN